MANAIGWAEFLMDLASWTAANEARHPETEESEEFDVVLDQWVSRGGPDELRSQAAFVIRRCRDILDEELNLGDGLQEGFSLKTLPDCIGDLTHLKVIRLVGNQLVSLPRSIGNLSRLTAIYLFGNRLADLPNDICKCTDLERLYLALNRLETLPAGIGALRKLKVLSVPGNRLVTLPESVGELAGLRDLYLFDNPLTGLPASFYRLRNLERVHLGHQFLKEQRALSGAEAGELPR